MSLLRVFPPRSGTDGLWQIERHGDGRGWHSHWAVGAIRFDVEVETTIVTRNGEDAPALLCRGRVVVANPEDDQVVLIRPEVLRYLRYEDR